MTRRHPLLQAYVAEYSVLLLVISAHPCFLPHFLVQGIVSFSALCLADGSLPFSASRRSLRSGAQRQRASGRDDNHSGATQSPSAERRYHNPVREKVLQCIREWCLLRAGDRVAVAVSAGADSVALLRTLLQLRAELGIVLSVAHFNHGLRAEQSNADEAFVAEVGKELGLECFVGRADVRDHALTSKLSIEAAGRELRYRWFADLAEEQRLDAIATAHTLDDQAETVLLKFLRGAGTRGLAGIYPVIDLPRGAVIEAGNEKQIPRFAGDDNNGIADADDSSLTVTNNSERHGYRIVRPLLGVTRREVEAYLTSLGQQWREDESNLDRRFLRNRVRHELLPLLEREFNPNIRQALSDAAEIARAEDDYWQEQVERELAGRTRNDALSLESFNQFPLALQRRLLKTFAERHNLTLDFKHIEQLQLCALGALPKTELPGGWIAVRAEDELLIQAPAVQQTTSSYSYSLPIPGEVMIPELSLSLRAYIVSLEFAREAAPGELLSLDLVGPELTVRNWLPGDRFCPAHSRSEEKLKRLFLEKKIPAEQRPSWPVALCGNDIVWVRDFPVANAYRWRGDGEALRIEALAAGSLQPG